MVNHMGIFFKNLYATAYPRFAPKPFPIEVFLGQLAIPKKRPNHAVMTENEIILVRHGQANTGAQTEEDYDRLSPTGQQQAAWLGQYLRDHDHSFDRLLCGTLNRHIQTVDHMNVDLPLVQDARLNEMRYFDMAKAYQDQTGTPMPKSEAEFTLHVPHVFQAWSEGAFDHVHEAYDAFRTRISTVLSELSGLGGRTLCITSGGVIGMTMAMHLDLAPKGFAGILLPIRNSSMHHFNIVSGTTQLGCFNAVPHLAHTDRAHARTTI